MRSPPLRRKERQRQQPKDVAEQPQLSQPVFTREVLQPSDHLRGPPLDSLQQVHVLLMLGPPELNTILQDFIYSTDYTLYPVIGHMGMVKSCTRGGLDQTLGSIYLPRGWSNTGTGFLERWSMPQACQCLRGIWTMPLTTCFNFWSALNLVRQLD
ncbi:hypothetical protein QYF61_018713 [Mycteria americana]|uniref:Uncharacterized protein n=1 Tax=Mycteria americana TaxID=33587 RepID=A0AAN7S3V1_MYCAM|nr:hypothetical protein QYF61_018713 [Mycteria americana]